MQKKKRNFLANWSIAVGTGTFVIGAGVYLGLSAAMKHNALAQYDAVIAEPSPVIADTAPDNDDENKRISSTRLLPLDDELSDVVEAEVMAEDNDLQQPGIGDGLAENEASDFDSEQLPEGETSPSASPPDRPDSIEQAPATKQKRFQRAPAPAPSAAVRLASGEEVRVPAGQRIDQFLASRDGSRMDDYIEQVYSSGPAQDSTYHPNRPTN